MSNRDIDASDPALAQAWKEMSDQKSENNWCLFKLESRTRSTQHTRAGYNGGCSRRYTLEDGSTLPASAESTSLLCHISCCRIVFLSCSISPSPFPSRRSPSLFSPCGAVLSDKVLALAGQGSGGYEELLQHFDQSYVMFGALKVIGKDNRQTLEAFRPKYVFFTFIGDKVSVLQRAKVSVQRGAAEKIFNGYSTRLDVPGNLSNFTRLEISKELLKCGGAHTPSHYIFGPGDEVEVKNLEQMS